MTHFFVPKTADIKMPDGSHQVVVRGIREVPDALANSQIANKYGIKPVHEMTNEERASMGMPPAPPDVVEVEKPSPAPVHQPAVPSKP